MNWMKQTSMVALLGLLTGCAGSNLAETAGPSANSATSNGAIAASDAIWGGMTPRQKFEKDREAILSLAGAYEVTFQFEETVPMQADYTLHEPHVSGGHELVIVLVDEPERIELQHLLLVGKEQVVKHWREVWEYQHPERLEFEGRNQWQ